MTKKLTRLNPADLFDSTQNHHAQGTLVEGGKLAFFSGQIPWQRDHEAAPESLREQTELVCRNLQTCLESVGASTEDIVSLRAYIVNWSAEMAAEVFPPLVAFLGEATPSMTGIGVASLFGPDLKIEIEMVVLVDWSVSRAHQSSRSGWVRASVRVRVRRRDESGANAEAARAPGDEGRTRYLPCSRL